MATLKCVVVRDSALDAFLRPFFAPSLGVAERSFADEVNRDDSEMGKHPDDYELYFLGDYLEDSARFLLRDQPQLMSRAKDVVKK